MKRGRQLLETLEESEMSFITVKFGGILILEMWPLQFFFYLFILFDEWYTSSYSKWFASLDDAEELFNPNCVTVNLLDNLRRRCGCQKGGLKTKSFWFNISVMNKLKQTTVSNRAKPLMSIWEDYNDNSIRSLSLFNNWLYLSADSWVDANFFVLHFCQLLWICQMRMAI